MITQMVESSQVINQVKDRRPRRERRLDILAERRRLKKAMKEAKRKSMTVDFDNITVTNYGNMQLIENFKLAIGFRDLLKEHISLIKVIAIFSSITFRLFN